MYFSYTFINFRNGLVFLGYSKYYLEVHIHGYCGGGGWGWGGGGGGGGGVRLTRNKNCQHLTLVKVSIHLGILKTKISRNFNVIKITF